MSKGPKTLETKTREQTTQREQIDPWLQQQQQDVFGRALDLANTPYQPFSGQRFEGFTPDQQAAFEAARQASGAGTDATNRAAGAAQGLIGFQNPFQAAQSFGGPEAQQVSAFGGGKAFDPGSVAAQRIAAERGPGGYEAYQSPFEQQVVDRSLGDIERARAEATAATRSQAAQAGAFGGSRSGVAESLTNRDFANQAASTAANLRNLGFSQSLGFNQADQNRALQADLANQGAGLQAGLGSLQARTQAGLAGQGQGLQAQLANQAANLQAGQFTADQLQRGSQFNAANAAQFGLGAGHLGLGGAGLLGQLGGQQQQMGAFGADLLSRIGGQQQALGQAGRDFDYQQFLEQRNKPFGDVDLLSQLLARGQFGRTGTSQSSGTRIDPNPNRGSLLGTLGAIGGTVLGRRRGE